MSSLAERWLDRIEAESRKASPSMRAVVEAAASRDGHFRAEELVAELPHIGRATVYRTLRLMVRLGILCRVLLADDSLHYLPGGAGHHHHVVCVRCGNVVDVFACDMSELLDRVSRELSFTVLGHRLEIYGRCAACQAETRQGGSS